MIFQGSKMCMGRYFRFFLVYCILLQKVEMKICQGWIQ